MTVETKKLAIVIPAYKSTFLKKSVDSILNQTNQRFNLYIGIDGPLCDTINVLESYKGKENLTIHIFDENLGAKDLVAQWERCIAMSKNEEYIWLFPDDDVMSPDCVESFYQFIAHSDERPWLLRFNNYRIDDEGNPITELKPLPEKESGDEYMLARIFHGRISSVAEHIFAREAYYKIGFYKLPVAWNSDTITWFLYGNEKKIKTIKKGNIQLRQSNQNISNMAKGFNRQKLKASYLTFFFLKKDGFYERYSHQFENDGGIKSFLKQRLFYLYNLYEYKFSLLEIFIYAYKNNNLLKDGFLRNIWRLIARKYRKF